MVHYRFKKLRHQGQRLILGKTSLDKTENIKKN